MYRTCTVYPYSSSFYFCTDGLLDNVYIDSNDDMKISNKNCLWVWRMNGWILELDTCCKTWTFVIVITRAALTTPLLVFFPFCTSTLILVMDSTRTLRLRVRVVSIVVYFQFVILLWIQSQSQSQFIHSVHRNCNCDKMWRAILHVQVQGTTFNRSVCRFCSGVNIKS